MSDLPASQARTQDSGSRCDAEVDTSHASATLSANEVAVTLSYDELEPHLVIVRPARPSLTYERVE